VATEGGVHATKVDRTAVVGGHHEKSVLTEVLLHTLGEVAQAFVQSHDHAAVVATTASRQVRAARDVTGQGLQGRVRRSVRHVQEQRGLFILCNCGICVNKVGVLSEIYIATRNKETTFGVTLRVLLDVLVRSRGNGNSGVLRFSIVLVSIRVRSGLARAAQEKLTNEIRLEILLTATCEVSATLSYLWLPTTLGCAAS